MVMHREDSNFESQKGCLAGFRGVDDSIEMAMIGEAADDQADRPISIDLGSLTESERSVEDLCDQMIRDANLGAHAPAQLI